MRSTRVAVLVLAAAGLVGLAVAALTMHSSESFTLGVQSVRPAPPIKPGHTACQRPIVVPPDGTFDSVDFEVGNYFHPHGPPLDVTVRDLGGHQPVRRGVLPAGYPDVGIQQRHVVHVGTVHGPAQIEVCIHNRGPIKVALFGNDDAATQPSTGLIDDAAISFDYDLVFRRGSRSFATLLPVMARRASLFRPPWVSPGLYYALLALLLVGGPLLLARAVRDFDRSD